MADSLSFLIKPSSYRCNLNCVYCFYKRVESVYDNEITMMDRNTAVTLAKKALDFNARHYSFCWQGGEPTLLGLDFYREVLDFQDSYRRIDQVIENSLQTNGILLDDRWCRFLRENNILVGISLDGPEDIHDRYRRDHGGRGTFQDVMKSISAMKKHRVDFNILTLLTDANINEAGRVYAFFMNNRFQFIQFITCCDCDPVNFTLTPYSVTGDDLGRFYCAIFDRWIEDGFPGVSIRLFEDILLYHFQGVKASCCWLDRCDSYIVVEHNGDCYPCDFYVYPEWKLGNINEQSLEKILSNEKRQKFSLMKSHISDLCRSCEVFDFCRGDCTRFRQPAGQEESGMSVYCESMKMLLRHVANKMQYIEEKMENILSGTMDGVRVKLNGARVKTGRNDPCPCGSGRKYKRCCGIDS